MSRPLSCESTRCAMRKPHARPIAGAALCAISSFAWAQSTGSLTLDSFKDIDILQIAARVSTATGNTFVIEPGVRGHVTLLSTTALSPNAFYQSFLALLEAHGFLAVPAGDVVVIVADPNAPAVSPVVSQSGTRPTADEIVTQVVAITNVSAVRLAPIVRDVIAPDGHLMAYAPANLLVFSDRASHMRGLMSFIRRLDQPGVQDLEGLAGVLRTGPRK